MVTGSYSLEQFAVPTPPGRAAGGCAGCGKGDSQERCGNGLEKIYPTTAVRFGYMRFIGEFSHASDMKFTCGSKVVILTKRGLEIGDQVSLTCNGCDKSVTRDQMREWVRRCGEDSFIFEAGRILREATAGDLAEYARIQSRCAERRAFAQQMADRHTLPLRIVECEHLFGGERIIFFFTANERVDFRAMVKDLAREYRTRIEMRQIGARDEARLLADYETCGREVCCKVFLKTLRPISMRMAKLQKATLDPTQVSGRCGRLKCCLRYEHEGYEELDKKLPRVGVRVSTAHGDGVIVNRQVLTQLVQIRADNGTLMTVVLEDILKVGVPAPDAGVPTPRPARGSARSRDTSGPRERGSHGARRDRNEPRPDVPTTAEPAPPESSGAEPSDPAPDVSDERASEQRQGRRRRRPRRRRGGSGGDGEPSNPGGSS